jgi:predicted nuclease of predicted toxin-antitoxin system
VYKLLKKLNDIFPEVLQVRQLKINQYDDRQIWEYAKSHSYVIATQDVGFANLVALYGPPPKVIWIRCRKSVKSIPRKIDTNALRRYCWI